MGRREKEMRNALFLILSSVALVVLAAVAHGQGTIQFPNGALTKATFTTWTGVRGDIPPGIALNFGVFVNGSDLPQQPLGKNSTLNPGIIDAPNIYAISGTEPLQVVSMQIRGWSAEFGNDWLGAARSPGAWYAETDVRWVTLGFPAAASAVIWQTRAGVSPNRFYPLVFLIAPEPSGGALLGLGILVLVFGRWKARTK